MDIVVIGAGIVGLTSAWYLREDGHKVTVVDRCEAVGMGASHANGGQLSYRYVAPLADPDVIAKIPGWMLSADAPVRFRPRFDLDQWRWLTNFLKACNRTDRVRSVAALLPLSLHSQALTRELAETHRLDFDFVRNGKLVVHRDRRTLDGARRLLDATPELTGEQDALDANACVALEPALARLRGEIAGGIHTRGEDAGDCLKLCRALAARMQEGPNPVRFALGQTLVDVERQRDRVVAVRTATQRIPLDACVIAAGTAAGPILRKLGVEVPIYPVKGYSLRVPVTPSATVPAINVTDFQRKIVYARFGKQLRVAGMADIVGASERIEGDRIATLLRETRGAFGEWIDRAPVTPWAGLRPATPTGRPIIDSAGAQNLWVNIGHGALGFTLAAGSARLLADRIGAREAAIPHAEFLLSAAAPSGWGRSKAA